MEKSFSNVAPNSSKPWACTFEPREFAFLALMDIIPLVLGQPVIIRLFFISFTSKKATDILNCNLALFHSLQYLTSLVHLILLILLQQVHVKILKFLLVYAQIGGPMSLAFICMERYVAVIHPTSYPLLKKYRFREVCVTLVWLFSVPMAFINVASEVLSPIRQKVVKCIPFAVLVVMTAMMVRSSICIAWVLKRCSPGRDEVHPAKRRAFKTVCATSAIVFICYSPVSSLQMFNFGNEYVLECFVTPVCVFLMSAASVVHPLFYLSTQGKLSTCLK